MDVRMSLMQNLVDHVLAIGARCACAQRALEVLRCTLVKNAEDGSV